MEDDASRLPSWLGDPVLNTGDDEESSPTIGMRIAGRVPPPPPAPTAPPPMPPVQFDPSKIPGSIRPQPTKLATVPGSDGLSVHPALLSAVSAGNGAPSMPNFGFDPNKIPESEKYLFLGKIKILSST